MVLAFVLLAINNIYFVSVCELNMKRKKFNFNKEIESKIVDKNI